MKFETKVGIAAFGIWLFGALVSVTTSALLIYVAVHFIRKIW